VIACVVEERHRRMAGLYCDRSRPGWRDHAKGSAYQDAIAAAFASCTGETARHLRVAEVERWADSVQLPGLR